MRIVIHGVKLYAHCNTWSDAVCSYLYMDQSSEALCSMLYKGESLCTLPYME